MPTPPASIAKINTLTLPAGTRLHRVHSSRFEGNRFNPCLGAPTRFAPIASDAGECVPTMYAADTLECAVFETIFHNVPATAPLKLVRLREVLIRTCSVIELGRAVRLATLFEPDLKALRTTRRNLTQTTAAHYRQTARWAAAIHHVTRVDGLVWTSNQCDPDRAYLLFGDRLDAAHLRILDRRDVSRDLALVDEIRRFGARAGIKLVV